MNVLFAYAALAYLCWGLFLVFPAVDRRARAGGGAAPHPVVAGFCAGCAGGAAAMGLDGRTAARQPRVLGAFAASALLLSANWLTYVWAVNNGHVVDASLGYFILPLVSVALGYFFFA